MIHLVSENMTSEKTSASLRTSLRTPVFLSHSTSDKIINISNGEKLFSGLQNVSMNVGCHWLEALSLCRSIAKTVVSMAKLWHLVQVEHAQLYKSTIYAIKLLTRLGNRRLGYIDRKCP